MKNIIIDTDAAFDDWWAILYLLKHPQINVKAISIVATGEAHGPEGARNIAKLCLLAGQADIPIAYGRSTPLEGDKAFPPFIRSMMDNLMGIELENNDHAKISNNAVELLYKTLATSKDSTTLLAIGPQTNLAELLNQHPDVKQHIESIVIMGGAVSVPGNIEGLLPDTDNKVSEWNFYVDPLAASIVCNSSVPIILVPLDLTNQFPLTKSFIKSATEKSDPISEFITKTLEILIKYFGEERVEKTCCFWDAIAAMVCANPEIAIRQPLSVQVDTQSGQTLTVESVEGQNVFKASALTLSAGEVASHYLETVSYEPKHREKRRDYFNMSC